MLMFLLGLLAIPLLGAALIAGSPAHAAKRVALAATSIAVALFIPIVAGFDFANNGTMQGGVEYAWLPTLGVKFAVGIDGVSLALLGLTVLLGPICVAASFTAITDRPKTFYAWLLILQAAITGVFCARDLVLFYICFEFTLIPMFILISLYGSTNRAKAAIKFFLYTFTGSLITLAGLVYVAWQHSLKHDGVWNFDIDTLAATARNLPLSTQGWVLLALMAGFAVKVPLFPVHTWLPLAHTEAPTAGSVVLAGTLLKLGTYGLYRFALGYVPGAMAEHAQTIAILCVVGIIYGGLICWVQRDVKKLVAYSSVAHLGFCVLGLVALNQTGITGSVLYMINHGLSTGALFLCIGMIYERFHTRNMAELGGLAARMPVWSTFMVFFAMASVGLPGLNGFVPEFLCLIGSFQADSRWGHGLWGSTTTSMASYGTRGDLGPWLTLIAGTGMIIAAMYLLYMVGRVVWGPLVLPPGFKADDGHGHGHDDSKGSHTAEAEKHDDHGHHSVLPTDLCGREIAILAPLAFLCLALGVYPKILTSSMDLAIDSQVKVLEEKLIERDRTRMGSTTPLVPVPPATKPNEGSGRPSASTIDSRIMVQNAGMQEAGR
ncbi:MAG: NADH-quinone oxidoreductase subunit M [Planctomycetes bacterium]|nr:NADH-quinone oxidoreductase subunit M [Planctomycetota bacterium]